MGVSDGEGRDVCEPDAEAEAVAEPVALVVAVAVACAAPPGLTTISTPAAAIAATAITLAAITGHLWPSRMRWIIVPSLPCVEPA
jgi:hypothetical protein